MSDPRNKDWIDLLLDEPDDDMVELDYEIYDDESNDLDPDMYYTAMKRFEFLNELVESTLLPPGWSGVNSTGHRETTRVH